MYKYKSGDTLDFGFITNPKDIFDGIISNKLKLNRSFESLSWNIGKGSNKSGQKKKQILIFISIKLYEKRSFNYYVTLCSRD